MSSDAPQATEPPPWWAAFPEVQASCARLEASEVLELLEQDAAASDAAARDFLLVDVRRTDWEGGTISTSLNLPAQSFYQTRATLHRLCKQAGVKRIIFYCGSSNGRGPRCAGWMQDYLDTVGDKSISAVILKGGIKGWQKSFGGKLMDFYDEKAWTTESK
ncbi:Rhodanese-like domain-containing protein [Stachybotrys elegans]|uniref:Rhodanese-like domain-containing protein n=1 Tax=Stachybotrys elegans TaxID=80388 RepID=A0A8K0SZR8_9HYPO|nr:Rhodanese-like domain-containing protein [Stachybotrys elegans]